MFWRKVHFELTSGGTPVTPSPMDLMVRQRLGENTIMTATIHHAGFQANNVQVFKEDTLMKVRWGTTPEDLATWHGYVHHSALDTASQRRPGNVEVGLVMVGTGHLLTDQTKQTWQNVTDSSIARQIARKHGLSSVVHKTTRVHRWLYQDGMSDMAFLTDRAASSGRKFWVENGTLYFVDVAAYAAGRAVFTPTFDDHKDPAKLFDTVKFTATVGGDMPQQGRQYQRAIYGVDHKTGRFIQSKNADTTRARGAVLSHARADSYPDLQYQLGGHTTSTSEWVGATATVIGSTRLAPGQPIVMTGRVVPKDLRGTWMVVGADHLLRSYGTTGVGNSTFMTRLDLARNARDTYVPSDKRMPRIADACVGGPAGWRAAAMQEITL